MRMRERSSVERIRMALTERRDMLGDMIAVERGSFSREKRRREEKRREERRGEEGGEERNEWEKCECFSSKSQRLDVELYSDTLAIELVSTRVPTPEHHEVILHQLLNWFTNS